MDETLRLLEKNLIAAYKASGQGSYARRDPNPEAKLLALDTRKRIDAFLVEQPESEKAWRLKAGVEELLLHYDSALRALEKAIGLSRQRDPKDLKKVSLLREEAARWAQLMLSPAQLKALGDYLEAELAVRGCDHSPQITTKWLEREGIRKTQGVLGAFRCHGGFCDCEVLANVVHG